MPSRNLSAEALPPKYCRQSIAAELWEEEKKNKHMIRQ